MARTHALARHAGRALRWGGALCAVAAVAAMAPGTPVLGAAMHSVDVTLVAGKNAGDGGFDFNGYQRGAMTITVPAGWQVVVRYENASALAHSLIVLPSSGAQEAAPAGPPAFQGAMTKDLAAGLPKGTKTTVTFLASKAGTYAFVCGVPGHAVAGMWDKLVVSDTAKAPSVTPSGAAAISAK